MCIIFTSSNGTSEGTDKILSQYGEGQLVIVEGLRTEPIDQTSVTAEQNPISVAHVQQLIATSGTNREAQVRFKRKRESLGEKEENVHVQQKRKVEGVPMKAFLNLSLAKYGNITVRK
ncbi:hypothetical protein M1146_07890 [Patescibacteria group bacterium]|nr:hypothetical protein [Patescibacteria group bacterium]